MQAWVLQDQSDKQLSALKWQAVPQPVPADDEVLVKVHANGLNPVDYKLVEGGVASWTYPHVIGLDVAGEIAAIGSNVTDFQIGDRVFYHGDLARQGGFAEYVTTKADVVAQLPEKLSYEQGAALLCGAMTGYQAFYRKANLTNVHTVLVHAGAGGVGGIVIQLAKAAGKTVYTTVSKGKQAFVKQFGPDEMIDYHATDVTEAIKQLTDGLGVDLIINSIGSAEATKDLDRVAYNGCVVTIDGQPDIIQTDALDRGVGIYSLNLGGAHRSGNPVQRHDLAVMAEALGQLTAAGQLDPMIERILPVSAVPEGLQMLKDHQVTGKLVVRWDEGQTESK